MSSKSITRESHWRLLKGADPAGLRVLLLKSGFRNRQPPCILPFRIFDSRNSLQGRYLEILDACECSIATIACNGFLGV